MSKTIVMNKYQAPKKTAVTGFIVKKTDVKAAENEKMLVNGYNDFVEIQVMDLTDRTVTSVRANPVQIAEFGFAKDLFVGNYITVMVDECIADVTGFINAEGEEEAHKITHVAIRNVTSIPDAIMEIDGVPARAIDNILAKRREVELIVGNTASPFHAGRTTELPKAKIDQLVERYENSTDPAYKATVYNRLIALGWTPKDAASTAKDAAKAEKSK